MCAWGHGRACGARRWKEFSSSPLEMWGRRKKQSWTCACERESKGRPKATSIDLIRHGGLCSMHPLSPNSTCTTSAGRGIMIWGWHGGGGGGGGGDGGMAESFLPVRQLACLTSSEACTRFSSGNEGSPSVHPCCHRRGDVAYRSGSTRRFEMSATVGIDESRGKGNANH